MKILNSFILVTAAVVVSAVSSNAQLTLNFSSSPGSTIQFNGTQNSLQLNSSTFGGFGGIYLGTQWFVGSENGGTGSAVGLFGDVANGPFSYGAITVNGTEQSAAITGPLGGLSINDGVGNSLTGIVDWAKIQTFEYSGALNASLVVNVSSLNYNGSNPDLQALVATGLGAMNLSFQFAPGETLTQLSSGSTPFKTSYSGSIAAVPEPASMGLLFLGLGALFFSKVLRKSNARFENQAFRGQDQSN